MEVFGGKPSSMFANTLPQNMFSCIMQNEIVHPPKADLTISQDVSGLGGVGFLMLSLEIAMKQGQVYKEPYFEKGTCVFGHGHAPPNTQESRS